MHLITIYIVFLFKKIQCNYLYTERCYIYMDHKSVKYFLTQEELDMRQRRWTEHLKGYDVIIDYHDEKANVVANAYSQNNFPALQALDAHFSSMEDGTLSVELVLKLMLLDRIIELHGKDEKCLARIVQVEKGETKDFEVRTDLLGETFHP
ncbi:uncharacterized protein LOC120197620 [Hibiscus syriacus]|uniref:uncharacterized protein LOC120197620 n=1 Tax=Hibiscus syriacus TaxID=106335 RepID=UPI0019220531|nr:uncharacterized protein LOC120197620 [Hibiscus syriacus]